MLLYSLANELLNIKKERTQSYWLYIYSGSFTRNKYNTTQKKYEIKIVIKYLQKALGKKEWKILKNIIFLQLSISRLMIFLRGLFLSIFSILHLFFCCFGMMLHSLAASFCMDNGFHFLVLSFCYFFCLVNLNPTSQKKNWFA